MSDESFRRAYVMLRVRHVRWLRLPRWHPYRWFRYDPTLLALQSEMRRRMPRG